ncbi:MAG: GNAT family N-acetyltransferase [Chloroflexota bacterium]
MQTNIQIREANQADLSAVIHLLVDDDLGRQRETEETVISQSYYDAFAEIEQDPNNAIFVAERDGQIIGAFQLMYLPSLSFQGGKRAQIESVRVATTLRGQGIGRVMMRWAIDQARQNGCVMVQLMSSKSRARAHHFYEQLGFSITHVGMKLML